MGLLLDTHVWIWSQVAPHELGEKSRARLEAPEERLYIATVSTLEIARLVTAEKLELRTPLDEWVSASTDLLQATTIELSHEVALGAYRLPGSFHRDPADRILAATARAHDLTLMTADDRILTYPHLAAVDARD